VVILNCTCGYSNWYKGQPGAWSSRFARGPGKGRTTWGLCTQPFPANICKRLFPRLEPVTSWSQGGSFYHCAKALQIEIHRNNHIVILDLWTARWPQLFVTFDSLNKFRRQYILIHRTSNVVLPPFQASCKTKTETNIVLSLIQEAVSAAKCCSSETKLLGNKRSPSFDEIKHS
jgi:hypothetical protein